ncbi:hypothetical protein SAMN05216298_0418 [Glycomyces sambucus]|uniref:Uncharacterized protein n=1 Tax=Glycomyces sambucus TaxID=380244 RepID=A0A1G9CMH3_9ACTN|nr:DUF6338 family protein [Glycomyces sambucus]SDK52828.1 hypothetical protein SAMN05216298_0418 [Glycomyces sambucus]
MPTNFLGVVYYLALLVPGFLYMVGRERHGPERKLDGFRQAANVVFVSVMSELTVLIGLSWFWIPRLNEKKLLTDTASYWKEGPVQLLSFYLIGLFLASCLAYFASLPHARRVLNWILDRLTLPVFRTEGREDVHPSITSAWWRLFHHSPEAILKNYNGTTISRWKFWTWFKSQDQPSVLTLVLLVLDSGTQVQGYVDTFNPDSHDISDRDIILRQPILRRASDEAEWVELPSEYACFGRGNVIEMYVQYFEQT